MKNIHILPTDNKYSRLYFNINDKEYQICENEKTSTVLKPNRHIYITNDEEKKNGEWVLSSLNEIVSDPAFHSEDYESSKKFFLEVYFGNKNLIAKFSSETNRNPFLNNQTKKEYLEWLEEKFEICYDNYQSFSRK